MCGLWTSKRPDLYTLPISARPPALWSRTFKTIAFVILWLFACLMINGTQFFLILPIRLLPFRSARRLYYEGIRWTKGCFGCLLSTCVWARSIVCETYGSYGSLVLMCQWFAPTKLRITFETQGPGKFSREEIDRVVQKDAEGEVVTLNLPSKFVLIANHQVSAS